MIKDIQLSIENLKLHTETNITEIQKSKIPILYPMVVERRYKFSTHGFLHSVYKDTDVCFLCKNIPYTVKERKSHIFADSMKNMVDRKEIYPFLLFLDGKFIKWNNITIVNDCNFSYIIISNIINKDSFVIECILLPELTEYVETTSLIDDRVMFSFDNNGYLTSKALGAIHILNHDKNILFDSIDMLNNSKCETSIVKYNELISNSNIIVFNNGIIDTSLSIKQYGLGIFEINNSVLVGNITSKVFYYKKSNSSMNNITNPSNIVNTKSKLKSAYVPESLRKMNNKFDFKFDRELSYNDNINNALSFIMKYNPNLLNSVYTSKSNIESRTYTGLKFKSLADSNGYIKISKRLNQSLDTELIIFKNGLLYEGYKEIKQYNKYFIVPIINISDLDKIELVFFLNVCNSKMDIYLDSTKDDIYNLDRSTDAENIRLYSINPNNPYFNIERSEKAQYEVAHISERLDDYRVKIIPNDSFYYDKTLSLVSSRQFRYMYKKITNLETECIILESKFNYCTDKNRYMVFINNKRIDSNNFKITLPKPSRAFYELSVYFNIGLKINDKIEIFYIPDELTEIVYEVDVPQSGIISIDKTKLQYGLDPNLYLVFVNGIKLRSDQLSEMSSNKIKISTSLTSTKNVTIIKHINDIDILKEIFNSNISELEDSINNLATSYINDMYKDSSIYTNTSTSIKEPVISNKDVLYNIIRDYYMKPGINNGDVFEFDFENNEFNEKDSDGNTLIKL